jgi:hypothetical protein
MGLRFNSRGSVGAAWFGVSWPENLVTARRTRSLVTRCRGKAAVRREGVALATDESTGPQRQSRWPL